MKKCMTYKPVGRLVSLACVSVMALSVLTGCSKSPYDGKWSYLYDAESVALEIDGSKAVLDGTPFTVTAQGDALRLDGKDGTICEVGPSDDDGELVLYRLTEYTYQGEGTPDGLLGVWTSAENWSFEFTADGTFYEDGYFPGYYFEDEAGESFTLVYNDHFEDTTCSYTIDGNVLTVKYPWPMVKTGTK